MDTKLTRMINQKNHDIALQAALRSGEDLRIINNNNNSNRNQNTNNNSKNNRQKISAKKQATIEANRSKPKHFRSRDLKL